MLLRDGTIQTDYTIRGCLYILDSRCNLISASELTEAKAPLEGQWKKEYMSFEYNGEEIGLAEKIDGLYHIKLAMIDDMKTSAPDKLAMVVDFQDKAWQWHFRLGHPS